MIKYLTSGEINFLFKKNLITNRLKNTWNELKDYCQSIDFMKVDEVTHSHIPYSKLLFFLISFI